eukprot:TRINITY_DN49685_c0_g1_i1.p1 TRINITY_DN49685_c0_g1~~TRINITY_DN49685_c0_g1_i1.p1  ORF type:complete len:189 (+),score=25.18 TRINITY_DN49685_c0_g1_i1:72-569(+)
MADSESVRADGHGHAFTEPSPAEAETQRLEAEVGSSCENPPASGASAKEPATASSCCAKSADGAHHIKAGKCSSCGKALRVLLAREVVQLLDQARASTLVLTVNEADGTHEWTRSTAKKKEINDANHKALDIFFNLTGESRREEDEYSFRKAKISLLKESLDALK